MRATSKRLCFIASIARSNNTLSGCFDPTFARGLTDFLLVQATVTASTRPSTGMMDLRRDKPDIRPSRCFREFYSYVRTAALGCPPRVARLLSVMPPSLNFQQRRFRRRLQQPFRILGWIAFAEHGVARYQNFRPRPHHVAHGVQSHAAIYFDAEDQ